MDRKTLHSQERWDPEPRWHAAIAVLVVGGLSLALPSYLTIGPRWLFPGVVGVLLVPTVISHRSGHHHLHRIFGFTVTGVMTSGLIASLIFLISALPAHKETPTDLLRSAACLWLTNILVFALCILASGCGRATPSRFTIRAS